MLFEKTLFPPVVAPKTLGAVVAVLPNAAVPPKADVCVVEAPPKMEPELFVVVPPNTLDDALLVALANIPPKGEAAAGAGVVTDPPKGEPVVAAPVVANPPKGEAAAGAPVDIAPPNGELIAGAVGLPKTD